MIIFPESVMMNLFHEQADHALRLFDLFVNNFEELRRSHDSELSSEVVTQH